MAGRESYKISNYWRHPRGKYNRRYRSTVLVDKMDRFRSVIFLFGRMFRKNNKWERQMFYIDNIKVPFNKLIGCRVSTHKWFYMDDEERAFCTKCHKNSEHIPRDTWNRMEKLKQIKKRTKN